jgi:hypothetical protein
MSTGARQWAERKVSVEKCDGEICRSVGSFTHPNLHITASLQRWRHRALAQRKWCPARPRPHHLLGSTSRASCVMTSPLATTMGSAHVKAARCVHGGMGGLGNHLLGEIRDQGHKCSV